MGLALPTFIHHVVIPMATLVQGIAFICLRSRLRRAERIYRMRSDLTMLPFKLVYHPRYDLNLGAHVFPSQKFRLLYELLLQEKIALPADFIQPDRASDQDILRVHTTQWIDKLKKGTLTASDIMKLEVPYSPELA